MKPWACVVCYRAEAQHLRVLVEALAPHVEQLLLMDNSAGTDRALPALAQGPTRYIPLPSNLGTGGAMNAAWQLALAGGAPAMLHFDQDSLPEPGMVGRLVRTLHELRARGLPVAAVGPAKVDPRTGHTGRLLRPVRFWRRFADARSAEPLQLDHLITSGSLIPADAFRAVGPYDEGLFLDYVDIEWCQRARAKGLQLWCEPRAQLRHTIGDRVVAARERMLALHTPMRNYLLVRNHLLLWRQGAIPRLWLASDALQVLKKLGATLLLAPPRLARLRWIARGIADGLRGRGGPPPA